MEQKDSSSLDSEAAEVCHRLASTFDLTTDCDEQDRQPGELSIGIEIEVPWSSYFPALWVKYGLSARRISALSPDEHIELTRECAELESVLLPRLHQTTACGIPRGNDRYWEFAFNPAHDTRLLVEQVRLLTDAGLLPRQRKHSLQITIGDMPRCRSLYYLAMLLEVQFVDSERIRSGIAQTQNIIHTGWARKGLAGIFEKGPADLKNGCQVACEIRMLQLPHDALDFSRLMATVQWGANAISEHRAGLGTPAALQWQAFESCAIEALKRQDLPDANWSRGAEGTEGAARGRNVWDFFGSKLAELKNDLQSNFDLDKITNPRKFPSLASRP